MIDHDPYVSAYPEVQAFWQAADQGRFLLPRCGSCGKFHWFPRAHCPFCHSSDMKWIDASGSASLYSFTVMQRSGKPLFLAYVELAEGPVILSNVVECESASLVIGMPLRVAWQVTPPGRQVPVFKPAPRS